MKIRCLTAFVAFAVLQQQPSPPPPSSIEGIVVRQGTNEPLGGVDLELSRVEGTSASPFAPGVAENFASLLNYNGPGLPPTTGATPPPLLAPEVKYATTSNDGRFTFRDLKEGKYRLSAVRGGSYFPAEFGQRDLMQRGLNLETVAWQDPEFMRSFENRGVAARIAEGGKASVDVKIIEK
jgi:hypothetical protein